MIVFCNTIAEPEKSVFSLAGLFAPDIRETAEMYYQFDHPFILDGSAYQTAFGSVATPYREALRQTIAWYRQTQPAPTDQG